MKKVICIILSLVMCLGLFAGCGNTASDKPSDTQTPGASGDTTTAEHPKVSFNIAYTATEGSYTDMVVSYWEKQVEAAGVNIELTRYPNSVFGSETSIVDQALTGTLDIVVGATSLTSTAVPAYTGLELPFLIEDEALMQKMLSDPEIEAYLEARCEEVGLIYLGDITIAPRGLSNHLRPVRSAADCEGMTIRCMNAPLPVAALTALGITPATLSVSEVYAALQQNVLDGTDQDLSFGVDVRFFEIDTYYTETNYTWAIGCSWMSKVAWDKMDEAQQKVMMETAAAAEAYAFELGAELKETYVERCVEMNPDFQIIYNSDLTAEEKASFTEPTKHLWAENRDTIGAEFYDLVMEKVEYYKAN